MENSHQDPPDSHTMPRFGNPRFWINLENPRPITGQRLTRKRRLTMAAARRYTPRTGTTSRSAGFLRFFPLGERVKRPWKGNPGVKSQHILPTERWKWGCVTLKWLREQRTPPCLTILTRAQSNELYSTLAEAQLAECGSQV